PTALRLDVDGLHHPRTPRGGGFAFTRYEDISHLATSSRAVWIGTRASVYLVARRAFVDPAAPERLVRALLARIAQRPEGAAQLARMAQIEELARMPGSQRATWGLAVACLVAFALQLALGDAVQVVGYYSPPLVEDGDWWRLLTANLLHAAPAFPAHLVLNLLGLLAIGSLVERSVGTARTLCIMGASGLGSMVASGLTSDVGVVGVSGVVFGLLGALTWLELRAGEHLPAWWRVPRRALYVVLVVSAVLGFAVPFVAGAAHVGGFVCGALALAAVRGRRLGPHPSPGWVRAGAGAVLAATLAAVVAAGSDLLAPGDFMARQTARLARLPDIDPMELNNRAWFIAEGMDASREHLEAALLLAERAVAETQRTQASMLDTLAEIEFQLGRPERAAEIIEEAIAQAEDERFAEYYREQRRRFRGERAADDRPEAPMLWHFFPAPREPEEAEESGVMV
ncbi:MAG TPA: rhomboid family intramembrane serine protease, partial [Myxococcota bacterium]